MGLLHFTSPIAIRYSGKKALRYICDVLRDEVDRMYERALLTNVLVEAESVGRDNKHGFVREDRGEVIDSHSEAWINDC